VSVTTRVADARERAAAEREQVRDRRDGLARFRERVAAVEPATRREPTARAVAGGVTATGGGHDTAETVRRAFAETVAPHTDHDGPLRAVGAELGEQVALALAPTTDLAVTESVRRRLLTAAEGRREEMAATAAALDREVSELAAHGERVDGVVEWLVAADETPLTALEFDALRERHEQLGAHVDTLDAVAEQRQAFLAGTTSADGTVGVDHRSLVASLYEDFPSTYPVLSTVTRLAECCRDARLVVRDHLVRRV
jgi:hypothetical protein